jgi:hypothetical protein
MFPRQGIVRFAAASLIVLAIALPCRAQMNYVLNPAGYIVQVPTPSTYTFGAGMQVQPVVDPSGMFVRTNITPLVFPMMDPAASIVTAFPAPARGVFNGGVPQPAFMNQPLIVVGGVQQQNFPNRLGGQFAFTRAAFINRTPNTAAFMPQMQGMMFPFSPFGQFQSFPFMPMQPWQQTMMASPMAQLQGQLQAVSVPVMPAQATFMPGVAQPGMFGNWQPWAGQGMAQPGMVGPLVMPDF